MPTQYQRVFSFQERMYMHMVDLTYIGNCAVWRRSLSTYQSTDSISKYPIDIAIFNVDLFLLGIHVINTICVYVCCACQSFENYLFVIWVSEIYHDPKFCMIIILNKCKQTEIYRADIMFL